MKKQRQKNDNCITAFPVAVCIFMVMDISVKGERKSTAKSRAIHLILWRELLKSIFRQKCRTWTD